MKGVQQHIQKRKQLEPYPNPHWPIRIIDGAAVAAGIIGPLMAMPQLMKIFVERNASGVSPISWFSWAILDIPFIVYGIIHRDRVIIITYIGWLFLNLLVGTGALMYG